MKTFFIQISHKLLTNYTSWLPFKFGHKSVVLTWFENKFKVDGTSFPDAGSLATSAQVTREICPRDLKCRKAKQIIEIWRHKNYCIQGGFSCLAEIGSKRKLSFGHQLLSNSVCVRKTLFVTQCPKFKAKVSISVAINPVGDRDQ